MHKGYLFQIKLHKSSLYIILFRLYLKHDLCLNLKNKFKHYLNIKFKLFNKA